MTAIIFDVDDTLYDQTIPFRKAINKNFPHLTIEMEQLYEQYRKFSDNVFELTESGEMGLEEMHVYRIQEAFKCFGTTISAEAALIFQKDYQNNQKEIELLPDIQTVFELGLKENVTMGIITNGPKDHQKNKIKQLGIERWVPSEHIFISSEVGIAKPDVRIFELAQAKMGLVPDKTYYFGDSFENDIIGASQAGWQTIWSNRREKEVPQKEVQPHFIVNKEAELLPIVASLLKSKKI